MADRIDPLQTRNAHAHNSPNSLNLADTRFPFNPKLVDEVIAHLANAPENRRARQIGEWERIQRHTFRVAA